MVVTGQSECNRQLYHSVGQHCKILFLDSGQFKKAHMAFGMRGSVWSVQLDISDMTVVNWSV